MYGIILFLSFLASTVITVATKKKTTNKWLGLFIAFGVNTFTLITSTLILYQFDEETRWFGMGHSGLYVLILCIPLITWLNYFSGELVERLKKRE
ncbi:hypothetical protein [Ammoniphilus sp. YIM 78166]|uniref:hypothetical protein n=1 Tax=Ammoniphilus sp. YIM 78166 TaxID=1644106 RepID=UPI00106FD97C|nr:hypothetical protein [Ammoniphilus sp. YIM 78166]